MTRKITLTVCRSCVVQNPQGDSAFKDEAALRKTFEKKLKTGFLRTKLADLQVVDCLTNCENPNSVQIEREDGEILLGLIRSEAEVDEVIRFVRELKDEKKPLAVPEALHAKLIFVRPPREWRVGEDAFHADRIRLGSADSER